LVGDCDHTRKLPRSGSLTIKEGVGLRSNTGSPHLWSRRRRSRAFFRNWGNVDRFRDLVDDHRSTRFDAPALGFRLRLHGRGGWGNWWRLGDYRLRLGDQRLRL
jgi:hypothetical protein